MQDLMTGRTMNLKMMYFCSLFYLLMFFSGTEVTELGVEAGENITEPAVNSISLFPEGNEMGEDWHKKVNVGLTWHGSEQSVQMEIDGSEFNFGWFQRILPAVDYTKYCGIFGYFRVPQGFNGGRITAMFVLKHQNQEYYNAELGKCSESHGTWVEFYLPFTKFQPGQGALQKVFNTKMIQTGDALEISVGSVTEKIALEFRDFRLIGPEEEKKLCRQIHRKQLTRQLKPESELSESVHPRLLLFGSRLDRIRAKAAEGGIQQEGYEHFLHLADEAMKKINADDPFGKIFSFSRNTLLNDHVNRGRFEGTINPLVIPLETLAAAAVITGNEKYGRQASKALVNMARTLDIDCPEINQGFYYTRTFYIRTLALGYDWLYHYLTPEERQEVKTTLLGFVQDIYETSWTASWGRHPLHRVWNWDPGLVSCAGLGVLAMEGETRTCENAMLIQFRRHLHDYLTFGIDYDGSCHEGPSYISYGIGAGVPFAECLRDKNYGDLFTETNWRIIVPWLTAELLPNHPYWNNLSDCNHGQVAGCPVYIYTCGRLSKLAKEDPSIPGERLPVQANTQHGLDYIQHFSECPGTKHLSYGAMAELMGWCWNKSSNARHVATFGDASALAFVLFYEECPAATDPGIYLPESQFFRGRGLVVSRQGGYGPEAVHLAVEAGPHASGHDQSDKGTFTLRAYNADLVIDSGYGNDGFNEKSGSSFAHNIVIIDGKGQPLSWHNNSNGEITGYTHNDVFDWIRTDAKGAWNYRFSNWSEETIGMEVEKADRHYLFVRGKGGEIPPYLITYDDFRKKDGLPHEYTWQWHISPEFKFTIQKDRWIAEQNQEVYKVLTTAINRCSGRAVFTLTAPQTGKYNITGLTRCAGEDHGKSDSFLIRIGNGPQLCWDLTDSSTFTWSIVRERDTARDIILELTKGEQVQLELSAREPEAQLAFLGLKPVEEKLPDFGMEVTTNEAMIAAVDAVQDTKNPFLLQDGNGSKTDANLVVFPVMTPNGNTTTCWYETSKEGFHPKLMHSIHEVEPNFLMVLVPRANHTQALPLVKPLSSEMGMGVEVIWSDQWKDTLIFKADHNGKVPQFHRIAL